ncbi:MAG TPA: L,D-transpeptidase family protein [Chitinophagaceae bacterium]|nr:L,D-transpeptidase family protein [Chitinophagaceae bacterium]
MKIAITTLLGILFIVKAVAQPSFIETQKKYPHVAFAVKQKEDTLKKQFAAMGLEWPARQIYIRSFKYDSQLEVWVRNNSNEEYKLFKTYKVCAMAGSLGPKRIEGDYQVPEGFYYITEFNPKSEYTLALKLNYPNESDKLLSDSLRPGGGIYIHGSCITVGCIPIMDGQIQELYVLAANAKASGEDFIPVHIFPVKFSNKTSVDYLNKVERTDGDLQQFATRLKEVYDYFEKEKRLPLISVNEKGEYVLL